jgi:predicted O-linked N-acetylglucosamine transferase (SPINDLY family)
LVRFTHPTLNQPDSNPCGENSMPNLQEALTLAVAHFQAGRMGTAEEVCRQVLQVDPNQPDAWHLLGIIAHQSGQHALAVECILRAIAVRPQVADYRSNLAAAYHALGRLDEAVACCRQALQLQPELPAAHNNLGNALKDQGKLAEAEACYRRAVQIKPGFAAAHGNLGSVLHIQGRFGEAADCYRRAAELKPDSAAAHHNLGNALKDQGKLAEAVACYRKALQLKPEFAEAHYNLGNAIQAQGDLDGAGACYRHSVLLKPDYAKAHNNLGNVLLAQGNLDEAIASYRRALAIRPNDTRAHSNTLYAAQFEPGVTLAELSARHAQWDAQHAAALAAAWRPHANRRDPERRLRLGFSSPDLGFHPVGYFLIRTIEALGAESCETICYSDRVQEDDLTRRFRRSAHVWREVHGLSDEALAEQIRADCVDILFDLFGHTARSRLLVFARKPAPIQATWIGYVGTTGLAAMDYLIADRFQVAEGTEAHYREKILRLPDGYVCLDPPADAPDAGPLPAVRQGRVTFGSFNKPAKISPLVVQTWAGILRRVPRSRLVIRHQGFDAGSVRRRYESLFAGQGIESDRLELLGRATHADLLSEYQRIDLALDPFPYSGGLTTCEALWMGVPVITCPGGTFASRHALSHLSNVGLPDTVARDLSEYILMAVDWANDLSRLTTWRTELRGRMAASPLCDGPRFAANLMQALRTIWRAWCSGARP